MRPLASVSWKIWLTRLASDYDEEDDGFLFTRAKTSKVRASTPKAAPVSEQIVAELQPNRKDESKLADGTGDVVEQAKKKDKEQDVLLNAECQRRKAGEKIKTSF